MRDVGLRVGITLMSFVEAALLLLGETALLQLGEAPFCSYGGRGCAMSIIMIIIIINITFELFFF